MNQDEINQDSLDKIVREMILIYGNCSSTQRLLLAVQNLEINIQNLEARLQDIQQEVKILICQQ